VGASAELMASKWFDKAARTCRRRQTVGELRRSLAICARSLSLAIGDFDTAFGIPCRADRGAGRGLRKGRIYRRWAAAFGPA